MYLLQESDLDNTNKLRASEKVFYQYYRRNIPHKVRIPHKDAKAILKFMYLAIWKAMVEDLYIFEPPYKMGWFYIKETVGVNSGFYLDRKKWQECGDREKAIRYNIKTNGVKPFVHWKKTDVTKNTNLKYYRFKSVQDKTERKLGHIYMWDYIRDCADDPFKKDMRYHIM